MKHSSKTSPHIILYFDILGYKSLLKKGFICESDIMHTIADLNVHITKLTKTVKNMRIKSLLFSDNCVLCFPYDSCCELLTLFAYVVMCAQLIQERMLLHGLFIRGSICVGDVYINNHYVFGEGIIKAYEIENEVAIYPRIVIDDELINTILDCLERLRLRKCVLKTSKLLFPEMLDERNIFSLLFELCEGAPRKDAHLRNSVKARKDYDGQYFVDVLQSILSRGKIEDIKQVDLMKSCLLNKSFYATHNNILYGAEDSSLTDTNLKLCLICTVTLNALKSNANIPKVKAKYLWICSYINQFYKELGLEEPFSSTILRYYLTQNKETSE